MWQQIEHRSKVKVKDKVTKNMKTPVWAISFEREVVETSDWLQNVSDGNSN